MGSRFRDFLSSRKSTIPGEPVSVRTLSNLDDLIGAGTDQGIADELAQIASR
jgi:hypothetical protein